MIPTLTIAEMALRDLLRRRAVLGLLFALPMVFYLARRDDSESQAVKFVLLGLGFTISTAGLFATTAARGLDRRLRLCGYRTMSLHLGRLLALQVIGLGISVPYLGIILADQHVARVGSLGCALALTVLIAAPLGMLLGSVVPRELEGTLLLLAVLSAQFLSDPARPAGKCMPFWSAREIGAYAVDLAAGDDYLWRGVAHALVVASVLFALATTTSAVRLRRRGHVRPISALPTGAYRA